MSTTSTLTYSRSQGRPDEPARAEEEVEPVPVGPVVAGLAAVGGIQLVDAHGASLNVLSLTQGGHEDLLAGTRRRGQRVLSAGLGRRVGLVRRGGGRGGGGLGRCCVTNFGDVLVVDLDLDYRHGRGQLEKAGQETESGKRPHVVE